MHSDASHHNFSTYNQISVASPKPHLEDSTPKKKRVPMFRPNEKTKKKLNMIEVAALRQAKQAILNDREKKR